MFIYDTAQQQGRLSDGYRRLLEACYRAVGGDMDYSPQDSGGHPDENKRERT